MVKRPWPSVKVAPVMVINASSSESSTLHAGALRRGQHVVRMTMAPMMLVRCRMKG
jgi:hypothetical protein